MILHVSLMLLGFAFGFALLFLIAFKIKRNVLRAALCLIVGLILCYFTFVIGNNIGIKIDHAQATAVQSAQQRLESQQR